MNKGSIFELNSYQMRVDLLQVSQQACFRVLVLLEKHDFKLKQKEVSYNKRSITKLPSLQSHLVKASHLRVDIFDEFADTLILNEEVVTSRDVFHDVTFDDLVLENGDPVVDQDGRRGRLKVGPVEEITKINARLSKYN